EMSGEIWYSVGKYDVFPETFGPFLLGDPRVREIFMRHHADLLEPEFWQQHQQRIREGYVHDVFPYDRGRRFIHAMQAKQAIHEPSDGVAPVEVSVDVPQLGRDVHDQGALTGFQSGGTSSAD